MQEQFGIDSRTLNGTRTLVLRGELDMATAPELQRAALELSGAGEVVFDLTALQFIDSSGIRVLLLASEEISAAGGAARIVPGEKVRRVFEVAGLADMLSPPPAG